MNTAKKSLRIAIAVLHYFPYGGLERNMLAVAEELAGRGHQVTIFTLDWQGPLPAQHPERCQVKTLRVAALSNHARAEQFATAFAEAADGFDLRVGFNRLAHLDVCYIADTCFAAKALAGRPFWYRWLPRSRAFLAQEAAVVGAQSKTRVMLISPQQAQDYQTYYQLDGARVCMLPPGIKPNRKMPEDYTLRRAQLRSQEGLNENSRVLLAIGSDFARKGLARTIKALASCNDPTHELWVIGDDNPHAMRGLAARLGVATQVKFWGAQDAIEHFLWLADVLVHPAHSEAAGATLVEAIVAGLPVIATAECGFAHYIEAYQMGAVISQKDADTQLASIIKNLLQTPRARWMERGAKACANETLFSRAQVAADFIEAASTMRDAQGNPNA